MAVPRPPHFSRSATVSRGIARSRPISATMTTIWFSEPRERWAAVSRATDTALAFSRSVEGARRRLASPETQREPGTETRPASAGQAPAMLLHDFGALLASTKFHGYVLAGALRHPFLLAGALLSLFPILWMIAASFMPTGMANTFPPRLLPDHPTMQHYHDVFTRLSMGRYLMNSGIIAIVVCLVVAAFSGQATSPVTPPAAGSPRGSVCRSR